MKRLSGQRLYQALLNRAIETEAEFEQVERGLGFDVATITDAFDSNSSRAHEVFMGLLTPEAVERIANYLGCPPFRVYLMADVMTNEDVLVTEKLLKQFDKEADKDAANQKIAEYLDGLKQSTIMRRPDLICEELVGQTMSESLREACQKIDVPYKRVKDWSNGEPATLASIGTMREIAYTLRLPMLTVAAAFGVFGPDVFEWNGKPIDLRIELCEAMSISCW